MNRTPLGALLHQVETRPEEAAFIFAGDTWTYERLATESKRLAQGLSERGIRSGDRVALHMTNRPEMLVAYFACFQLGAIAAPLKTVFKLAELGPLLQRLKPALYIGEVGPYDNVAPIDISILASEKRFVIGAAAQTAGLQPWENLFETANNFHEITPAVHEPAVLITTSGTTGQPKFVIHTPTTLFENAYSLGENWGITGDDILPHYFSLSHASGLNASLCLIRVGAPFILLGSFDADAVLDVIERHRCTLCGGFPAQYAALLDRQLVKSRDVSSLRMCLTFGDVCSPEIQAQFSKAFEVPLYNLWGSTEVPAGPLTYGMQFGPVVRVVKGTQTRLIDDDGKDVCHGLVGELLVGGPSVFVGYWDDPKATAESLNDGWYRTGDLMRHGDGDEIWFVGRKKNLIVRGGIKISPVEVGEALIASHPSVEMAAAIGVPDRVFGQRVFGFVKLANGTTNTIIPDILRETAKRIADFKVPEDLAVLAEMPYTALGKLDREALTGMASERWQTLHDVPRQPTKSTGGSENSSGAPHPRG
jgi:long-chain acyl-CoA synthetase